MMGPASADEAIAPVDREWVDTPVPNGPADAFELHSDWLWEAFVRTAGEGSEDAQGSAL